MRPPELVIEGGPRPPLLRAVKELWASRALIRTFAERDIRVKYKQAVLGIAWALIQPLTFMLIFTVALARGAGVPGGGAPYPAFALSVLVAWTFFQTAVSFGTNALVSDGAVMRKVYFPREASVLGGVLGASVDFGVGLMLFVALGPFLGAQLSITWLLAPVLWVGLVILAAGVSFILGALNVYYRDFRHALPFLLQLWLFASPVAYPLTELPESWRLAYVILNPAAGILDGFRRVLALGQPPDLHLVAISVAGCVVVAMLGYRFFKRMEPNFADVV